MSKDKRRRRKVLFEKQDGKCCFCYRRTELPEVGLRELRRHHATVEHIISKKDGGVDALTNLAMSCYNCNTLRGTIPFHLFLNLQLWKSENREQRKQMIREQQNKLTQ